MDGSRRTTTIKRTVYGPSTHPWRGTRDSIGTRRSFKFSEYLSTLPPAERRVIEQAERAYVAKTESPNGTAFATLRDYAEGMLGMKETEPGSGLTDR